MENVILSIVYTKLESYDPGRGMIYPRKEALGTTGYNFLRTTMAHFIIWFGLLAHELACTYHSAQLCAPIGTAL